MLEEHRPINIDNWEGVDDNKGPFIMRRSARTHVFVGSRMLEERRPINIDNWEGVDDNKGPIYNAQDGAPLSTAVWVW